MLCEPKSPRCRWQRLCTAVYGSQTRRGQPGMAGGLGWAALKKKSDDNSRSHKRTVSSLSSFSVALLKVELLSQERGCISHPLRPSIHRDHFKKLLGQAVSINPEREHNGQPNDNLSRRCSTTPVGNENKGHQQICVRVYSRT